MTSSPSRTTTAAMSQWPSTTTRIAAARSRSTTRLRASGVAAARSRTVARSMAPAWRVAGPQRVSTRHHDPGTAGQTVVRGSAPVPWNGAHDRRRAASPLPHPGAPGRPRRRPGVRRRPRRPGPPHLPAGPADARRHGRVPGGARRRPRPLDRAAGRLLPRAGPAGGVEDLRARRARRPRPSGSVRAGFVPEDHEVVLLGRCADLVHDVDLPDGRRAARHRERRGLGARAGHGRRGVGHRHLVGQRQPARRAALAAPTS